MKGPKEMEKGVEMLEVKREETVITNNLGVTKRMLMEQVMLPEMLPETT